MKKPLGRKAYGSIPHLPTSRLGAGDHSANAGMSRICTEKCRPGDTIIVQEKIDGSCVAVARVAGEVLALGRAGYLAATSPYEQHRLFAEWVALHQKHFHGLLEDGERIVGEWVAQAHGTIYHDIDLKYSPFIAFDLMRDVERLVYDEFMDRLDSTLFTPHLISQGGPVTIEDADRLLRNGYAYPQEGDPEGLMYRVERNGKVDFLAKWVREGKQDGCFLPELSGGEPVWNWRPT